jgi:YceI-like domain
MKLSFKILLGVFFTQSAFAANGTVDILLNSAVDVKVFSKLKDIQVVSTDLGYNIDKAVVLTANLSVTPGAAKKNLHSKKFLNSAQYPEIIVSGVKCQREVNKVNGQCNGFLMIKGINKPIQAAQFVVENKQLKITFPFSISSYGIAHRVLLFNIKDTAKVTVRIGL